MREAKRHGQDLGLSDDELAFYDALAENGSARGIMKSDQLRLMARELAEMLKKMPRLDWTRRTGVHEILAIRPTRQGLECRRVEVQASMRPIVYMTRVLAARGMSGACNAVSLSYAWEGG